MPPLPYLRDSALGLNWDIEVFNETPSTQDICKTRAADGAAEGLVIQALKQSAGKGRHGREWISGEDNLTFSFLLRPECDVHLMGQLSLMVGVSLAKTMEGADASLKWPNDVLLGGKKCAGILIHSDIEDAELKSLVIGVGVNTVSAPDIGAALNVDRGVFLQALLGNISRDYAAWQSDGFTRIREEWLARTYPKGTQLNVGEFETIDDLGNLIVRDAQNQLQTISAGEVYLKDMHYAVSD